MKKNPPASTTEQDGDPKKITKEVKDEIERLLEGNPTKEGKNTMR
jgi:hypothetical protein